MHIAVTAVGADRPGIAAAVAKVLFDHGGNIEDSRMAILGGHFSIMLIVALPDGTDSTALEHDLAGDTKDLGLIVAVRPVAETTRELASGEPYVVSVYGADHPGIVYRVTAALAERRVNVTDLVTHVVEGPTPVYVMVLDVTIPAGLDPATVEADLKRLGAEIGVDVSVAPDEAETL
jgi:glycine cleavage system transcriptional repressor